MKILQISASDIQGGAARAAYRLHKGLRQIGEDCRVLARRKISDDDTVFGISDKDSSQNLCGEGSSFEVIQNHYINAHRTDVSNTIFTLPYPGYDISGLEIVRESDILNLHWVAYYQSPVTLRKLFSLGKPVVWTLHDEWAYTGGCHYSAGCKKYSEDCFECPQLSDDPFNIASAILRDKIELFKGANLTIVTPSHWLADCAKRSKLFSSLRIEVIPYSLETDRFIPIPKETAKSKLGIKDYTLTLLFGAESGTEKRKGFAELKEAIKYCLARADFQELARRKKVKIICFGIPSAELERTGIPTVSFGYLKSDEQICLAYSAADIFILPSLEDNFPNTMLEAMSCGTPVVAFNVGGMPDVVINDVTGKLIPLKDTSLMGDAICELAFNSPLRGELGRNCRKMMMEAFELKKQAQRYSALYESLLRPRAQKAINGSTNQGSNVDTFSYPSTSFLTVCAEAEIGPNFKEIYDRLLNKSLKEYALDLHKQSIELKESLSWKIAGPLRWLYEKFFLKKP